MVADAFDAMTTDRAYQPAKTLEAAMKEIRQNAGKKYDPGIVVALEKGWDSGLVKEISTR